MLNCFSHYVRFIFPFKITKFGNLWWRPLMTLQNPNSTDAALDVTQCQ